MHRFKQFWGVLVAVMLAALMLAPVSAQETEDVVVADFESGFKMSVAADGSGVGFVPWGDTHENVKLSVRQLIAFSEMGVPGKLDSPNNVLAVAYDIGGWGGVTHAFTDDGTEWISQDWTAHNAVSFWFYGSETGAAVQMDIFDNRSGPGDTAERWFYRFNDDFSGWMQITIPFELFERRTDFQPNGAPDDGLGLDQVSGYAFGMPVGTGPQVAYLDDIMLTTVSDTSTVLMDGGAVLEEVVIDESITWDSRQWNLIWSDEFEGEAGTPINDEFWTAEIGGHGWGNNELEYYTGRVENVSLDGNGNLAINAIQENPDNYSCHYGTCEYTSARIVTMGKMEFTYGRVEARIKIPRGQGVWPAFWMLGADFRTVGWPNSGEIDILENVGHELTTVHGTVHGPGYSGGNGIGASYQGDTPFSDDFHVYAIDWDPDAIRWYVDGELFNIITPNDLNGRDWVFDHDFFLILNVAVGGNWPGMPDETTVMPQTMLVDYVRVYQLAE